MTDRIGFIGLGLMGHRVAANIVGKGFPLTVMADRRREAVDDLKARLDTAARSPPRASQAGGRCGADEVVAVVHRLGRQPAATVNPRGPVPGSAPDPRPAGARPAWDGSRSSG